MVVMVGVRIAERDFEGVVVMERKKNPGKY